MTPDKTIELCDARIKHLGAKAKILLKVPGKWRGRNSRLLCKGGPIGQVRANLMDGKHILIAFSAAEVKTYLEGIKNGGVNNDRSTAPRPERVER